MNARLLRLSVLALVFTVLLAGYGGGINIASGEGGTSIGLIAALSPDGTRILVESWRGTSSDIFVVDTDGSNLHNLTNDDYNYQRSQWSPDGTKIASMSSGQDNNGAIVVINADGSEPPRRFEFAELPPCCDPLPWSPDSSRIAFEGLDGNQSDIFVADLSNGTLHNLTGTPAADYWPAWSPDGTQITFVSGSGENREIYIVNADGSDLRNITHNRGGFVNWSPDGTQIAFRSGAYENTEVYIVNTDGSDLRNVSNNSVDDFGLWWSPDGRHIAFQSNRNNTEIYIVNTGSNDLFRVNNSSALDGFLAWSPDGSRFAFESDSDIYVVNADGNALNNVTNSNASGSFVTWSPDGRQIVFAGDGLYIVNIDGSDLQTILDIGLSFVEWMPDGSRMLFAQYGSFLPDDSTIVYTVQSIYVVNADGSNLHRIFESEE